MLATDRAGDLNFQTSTYGRSKMQEGSYIHRKIQKTRGEFYHKEFPVKKTIEFAEGILKIGGRADGVELLENKLIIEELKSHSC